MNFFCEKLILDVQFFAAHEHFYEKMVISLALNGFASEEGIQRFLETNFWKHFSKEIASQERKVYAMLSDYYQYEDALNGQRVHEKTFQKLLSLEERLLPAMERCDTLRILYQWIKEMTSCRGIPLSGRGFPVRLDL